VAQSRSQKDSFVVYRSFYDAIKPLDEKDQLALLKQIFEFGLNQKEIDLEPLPKAMFSLIKPQLTANHRKYENGKKGGRPKTKTKPNQNQNETKSKPNVNVNVNVNDNVNVKKEKKPSTKDFDIQIFIDEGYSEDVLDSLVSHRRLLKKPILTNRMMQGLLRALTEYYKHWNIAPQEAVDFYLSKTWVSIDKEYKYTHRQIKEIKPTDNLSYSDIGKMLKEGKINTASESDSKILNLTKQMGV